MQRWGRRSLGLSFGDLFSPLKINNKAQITNSGPEIGGRELI